MGAAVQQVNAAKARVPLNHRLFASMLAGFQG
jgi:hypothetical protein